MDASVERLVRQRAVGRCEYGRLPQTGTQIPFEIDHIIASKHRGTTTSGNLAMSCYYGNAYKGPNFAGHDPVTGRLTKPFHSRRHKWIYHFRYAGGTLIGRTTIDVLRINLPNRAAIRELLIEGGAF